MPRRLLLTADTVGGVWSYAIDLARGLVSLGWETVLVTLGPAASAEQRADAGTIPGLRLIESGLPLDWVADAPGPVIEASARLAALAVEHGVDLVHLNSPVLAARARPNVPLVVGGHGCVASWWAETRGGMLPAAFGWHAELSAQGLAAADRVIAPSASHARILQRTYALPASPFVVPNGRTLPAPARGEPVAAAFTAGRLWDEAKNLGTLGRAARSMSVPLRAAGAVTGPKGERAPVAGLALLGSLGTDAIARALAERPVFVSAARFEPFGLAVLEAAGAGCALVLSDTATFRELWDGAATFIDADDAGGFARAVDRLIADPQARAAAGRLARARARRFTPERTASATAAIYRTLLPDASRRLPADKRAAA